MTMPIGSRWTTYRLSGSNGFGIVSKVVARSIQSKELSHANAKSA